VLSGTQTTTVQKREIDTGETTTTVETIPYISQFSIPKLDPDTSANLLAYTIDKGGTDALLGYRTYTTG
jgi:hypothetical protein